MVFQATVMIPVYNAERFIEETLKSAINQTFKGEYEILVINDGSTDDTLGKLSWYESQIPNLRVISQDNLGQPFTRNKLIEKSRGEILLGLDADDLLLPNAVQLVTDTFKKNPSCGFIYTNQLEIDEGGR